jgi:E3 ubiquitin-protein ligase UBR7
MQPGSSGTMSTLTEILASQENLIREASLALPHDFRNCTYRLGPLRQAVYLCLTCSQRRGICSACSIACHTDHEQVELFPKRNFRCDCPTVSLSHPCTLHRTPQEENESNHYGQNFSAMFCRCGRPYDANTERETMMQCLACEVRSCLSEFSYTYILIIL